MHPIDRARHDRQVMQSLCNAAVHVKASTPDVVIPGGGSLAFDDTSRDMRMASVQLAHNKDWVFACVRAIANRIAGQPIRVGRIKKAGRGRKGMATDGGVEILDSHPVLDLLNDPNEQMTSWGMIYFTFSCLELTGQAFWTIDDSGDGGRLQLWPLPPSWVEPIHKEGQIFAGWKVTPGGAGVPIPVHRDAIARFYYLDPADPVKGSRSPLQAIARAVNTDESIQTSQDVAFRNGIFPKTAIIVGDADEISPEGEQRRPLLEKHQRQQIISTIRAAYGGTMRYGEPLILDALIKDIKEIGRKPMEMDWMDSSTLTKSRILQGFGVNPIILGEIENANRASAVVAEQHFCSNLNAKLPQINEMLTQWGRFWFSDDSLVVWIEPCVPSDPETLRQNIETLAKYGAITRDEQRALLLGLPPLPDGAGKWPMIPGSLIREDLDVADSNLPDPEKDP